MNDRFSLETTVREIFKENTTYILPQQALNQAKSLNSLSADIYTDSLRFVYELIQNCDDSCDSQSQIRLAIVNNEYLIVSHNGKAFDSADVRGLCDVGCGTKSRDRNKTGYKGLGFKSVFGKSNYVVILSDGEYFRFEKNSPVFQWNSRWKSNQKIWEEENQRKFEFPWQICPIWTKPSEVPPSTMKWILGLSKGVATIIRLNNVQETISAIEQLKQQPNLFMFLRNVRNIRFTINSSQENLLVVRELHDKTLEILLDWQKISHWLLHRFTMEISDDARRDFRLPEKLQEDKTTEIILAARIDPNNNIESGQGRQNALFSYLPTKITTYNFPFLVNAQFLTNASREHIHTDSSWNRHLFASIPHLMMRWVAALVTQKWRDRAFDLIPKPINTTDLLAVTYNENCPTAAQNLPFIMNSDKKLLRIDQVVIDKTQLVLERILPRELTRDFILRMLNPKPNFDANPFIYNNNRLRQYPIFVFDWEHCFQLLQTPEFLDNFSITDNIRWIHFLFEHQRDGYIQTRLEQLIFVKDQDENLQFLNNIYVPSQFNQTDWTTVGQDQDHYVHDEILIWLRTNSVILQWLMSLGLREKTDITFIHRYILPKVSQYITRSNAFDTIRKLFTLFQNGRLSNEVLYQLRSLKLIASDNSLIPANHLYFSSRYQPRLSIENFRLDQHHFLSEKYFDELNCSSLLRVKEFFLSLGVQEDIRLTQYNEDDRAEIISAYSCRQTDHSTRRGNVVFQKRLTLPFLNVTQHNFEFSLYFWTHVINSIDGRFFNEKEILLVQQQQILVDNLIFWFVRNRECIPTTTNKLMKSEDVYSSDLKPLVADYLPSFACQIRSPLPNEWQNVFQFKTELSIRDHLDLLDSIRERSNGETLNDENQNLIQRIYKNFIVCLSKLNESDRHESSPREPIELLSTKNEFLSADELVFSSSKDFRLPPSISQLKLSDDNAKNPQLKYLLEFFRIRSIQLNDLNVSNRIQFESSTELNAKLRELRKFLFDDFNDPFELCSSRQIVKHDIDSDFQILEAERLELFFDEKSILQVPLHVSNNKIYVRQPWRENDVLSKLSDVLCEKFRLNSTFKNEIFKFLSNENVSNVAISSNSFSSIDLKNVDEPRKQFAKEIDRDNFQLFKQLNLNECENPKEFLLTILQIQKSDWSGYVYHYTNLENAIEILRQRTFKTRDELSFDEFKDSTPSYLIENLSNERKHFLHFYFRPLTPIQFLVENLSFVDSKDKTSICPIPVIFRFNLSSLLNIDDLKWKISLGDLSNSRVEFGNDWQILKKFDFSHLYDDIRSKRGRESSQQEFLIENRLKFDQLSSDDIQIFVQNPFVQSTLSKFIESSYEVLVDSTSFFNFKPQVFIHSDNSLSKLDVSIRNRNEFFKDEQIILQIYNRIDDQTITGEMNATYQRNSISTIFFKSQFSLKTDFSRIEYAIYYRYQNQIWFIHTNSSHYKFSSPE